MADSSESSTQQTATVSPEAREFHNQAFNPPAPARKKRGRPPKVRPEMVSDSQKLSLTKPEWLQMAEKASKDAIRGMTRPLKVRASERIWPVMVERMAKRLRRNDERNSKAAELAVEAAGVFILKSEGRDEGLVDRALCIWPTTYRDRCAQGYGEPWALAAESAERAFEAAEVLHGTLEAPDATTGQETED